MARKAKQAGDDADRLIKQSSGDIADDLDDHGGGIDPSDDQDHNDDFTDDLDALDVQPQRSDDDNWEHKYEVLQGKYNAEIPRMNSMLSDAMGRIAALEAENKELKEGKPQEHKDSGSDIDYSEELEKIKEQYPSLYKGLLAAVKVEASRLVKEATKTTVDRVNEMETRSAQKDLESYLSALSQKIPRWKEINVHPAFLRWLTNKDRFTGKTKSELLTDAYNRMDAETTAAFFLDFMEEKGIRNQQARTDADDIAPSESGTIVKRRATNTISQDEINKFYRDRAMGRYRGTEEEAARFERRVFQAIREGKVR